MTRSHGPFGPPGAPLRRRPGDDPIGASQQPGAGGQWPAQPQHGYGDPGYHFPPPEPQPAYGYSNPQLLAPQQWPPQAEQQAYEINYQAYGGEPGPFQHGAHGQHQGYDSDAEFGPGYYEDEEPRRGRRWLLIAVALVGAIGVGGALAFTYRSLVAPKSRLEAVKSDGKTRAGRKDMPVKVAAAAPAAKVAASEAQGDPAGGVESQGPRAVKTIPIVPGGGAPQAAPPVAAPSIPGITLYQAPGAPEAGPKAAAEAPAKDVGEAKEEVKEAPPKRVSIGTKPAPPPAEDDDPPAAAAKGKRPVQAAALAAPKAPAARSKEAASSGLGYVAVIKSEKTSMDAMKAYADLQQKYPDVLGDRSFDVQEADLSSRGLGTMYRVVVGPPGSHHAASGVCAQLKAAGYVGCWVKEY